MKKTRRILGLFGDFEQTIATIKDIRAGKISGVSVDDVTVISPIEHLEVAEALGDRPVYVQRFTFVGALFGLIGSFIWISAAQATFLVQPQGGKPVISMVSNFVLNYEMLILGGVLFSLAGFLIGARLPSRKGSLYSEKVSLDQIGIIIELTDASVESAKGLFQQHNVLEIREEVIK